MRRYLCCVFLIISFKTVSQTCAILDFGTGSQSNEPLSFDTGVSAGQVFLKNKALVFGGFKLQKFPIVPSHKLRDNENKYTGQTTDLWNFSFHTGFRYSINLFQPNKKSNKQIGIFPECRLYFSPLMPKKVIYVQNNFPEPDETITLKGQSVSQLAYAFSGGIYYGNLKRGYLALKFEVSTIDLFESLRPLNYKNDLFSAKGKQYIISLSLYGILTNRQ